MTHTVHMNQSTNRPFALGGLIHDTGVDAEHPPPWLRSGCTHYVPERDGALVDAEQTKKWRPLLEAINRGPKVALPTPEPPVLDFPVAPGWPELAGPSDLPLEITVIRYRHTGAMNPRGAWRYALVPRGA